MSKRFSKNLLCPCNRSSHHVLPAFIRSLSADQEEDLSPHVIARYEAIANNTGSLIILKLTDKPIVMQRSEESSSICLREMILRFPRRMTKVTMSLRAIARQSRFMPYEIASFLAMTWEGDKRKKPVQKPAFLRFM